MKENSPKLKKVIHFPSIIPNV